MCCFPPLRSPVFDLEARTAAFRAVAARQPGCTPYDNHRPLHVRKHSAGQTLSALLAQVRPYSVSPALMMDHIKRGWLTVDGKRPRLEQVLVAGNIVNFVVPDTVEPTIGVALTVLFEDDDMLVVDKPAPMAVHPSGRFNKNALVSLGALAWPDVSLKPVHRLDADTTGVLVLAKHRAAAHALIGQFKERRVQKRYLARVMGRPSEQQFTVEASIASAPAAAGAREMSASGQVAETTVELLGALGDGTSLVAVYPATGRTHQIRLHLQHVGLPIVGDTVYGPTPDTASGFAASEAGLCLHAQAVAFQHPQSSTLVTLESGLPPWFGAAAMGVVRRLRAHLVR